MSHPFVHELYRDRIPLKSDFLRERGMGEEQGDNGCCYKGGLESWLLCLAQEGSLAGSTDRFGFLKCQGAMNLHVICVPGFNFRYEE